MMKNTDFRFRCVTSFFMILIAWNCPADDLVDFKTASQKSKENAHTDEGRKYTESLQEVLFPKLGDAMKECSSRPDTDEPVDFICIVSAEGKIVQILTTPGVPYGECVAAKMRLYLPMAAPKPPQDNWAAAILLANHNNASKNAPEDKPLHGEGAQIAVYEKAVAPYIAKARATYPAARKRFLAGLPPKHRFSVWIRLYQTDAATNKKHFEDVFVWVDTIKDSTVRGHIANSLDLLTNYHEGDEISFSESEVKNWLISRPDGSEEGNYVGKFLDHYQPPK